MSACRRFLNVSTKSKNYFFTYKKCYCTSAKLKEETGKNEEIVIPNRIPRGPTDILKALASTISKDYTAPQYRYEDDPYFIPASNISKRSFALSKESGKKAARYFLENHPELFMCNKSVPHIKAFDPPIKYTQENVDSPDVLGECIKNFEVNNSITVYNILKEKGIAVSQEMKQELLELLCFYNGLQPLDEDYYEERYFMRNDRSNNRWNLKGEAERLFDEMEKDAKAYSAMIAGAAKFQDAERVQQLYDEMNSKDLCPTVEGYNSLISIIPYMKERRDAGCEYAMFLLSHMQRDGLVPNLYTMNAILEVFVRRKYKKAGSLALSILAEMRNLNIEPSLGTYSLILNIFCDESNAKIGVLYDIIKQLEGQELSARHPLDTTFFCNAMEKCHKYVQDKNLAYRINKIVEYKNNCKLMGNNFSESIYFKYFLRILSDFEDFEKFMEIYEQYVPNIYTPEPSLMNDILTNLQFTGQYKYLPKLCNDVYVFEQTERENILSLIMETAGSMKHEKKIQSDLVDIIWKIVEKINFRLEGGRFNFTWTGTDLGNALNTFINGKDLEKSWSVMKQLADEASNIIGPPSKESLLNFCRLFLEERDYEKVKFCLKYATKEAFPEFGKDFKKLTDSMFEESLLEDRHRVHVNTLLQSVSYDGTTQKSSSSESSSSDSSSDSSSSDEEDNK